MRGTVRMLKIAVIASSIVILFCLGFFLRTHSNKKISEVIEPVHNTNPKTSEVREPLKYDKKLMLCGLNKGEHQHLVNWILYHSLLGFDLVVVGMNEEPPYDPIFWDSETVATLIKTRKLEVYKYNGKLVKMKMMSDCVEKQKKERFQFMLFMDTDEVLHSYNNSSLSDFLQYNHSIYFHNKPVFNNNLMTSKCLLDINGICGPSAWGKTLNYIGSVGECVNPHYCSKDIRNTNLENLTCDDNTGACMPIATSDWVLFHSFRKSYQHVMWKNNRGQDGDIVYAPRPYIELLTQCGNEQVTVLHKDKVC